MRYAMAFLALSPSRQAADKKTDYYGAELLR